MRDINALDEAAIPASAANIPHPALLLTASLDPVGLPDVQVNNTAPYAKKIRVRSLEGGHFVHLERPNEVNSEIRSLVDNVTGNMKSQVQ
ncbi:hypothetical protein BFW01_g5901 [Lasiodiplodia theobromae]|nr:hypothetical protein BFW01_g5901 [Lasiodiplodia theobromae]